MRPLMVSTVDDLAQFLTAMLRLPRRGLDIRTSLYIKRPPGRFAGSSSRLPALLA